MRAKILLVLLLFIGQQAYSQTITVDDTMTPEELVVNVLFQDVCGNEPTNIQVTNHSGADNLAGETNGANLGFESYGYFDTGAAAFPFTEGIILSSSSIVAIPDNGGAFMSFGGTSWEGDANLELLAGGGNTFNATAIEFEFVPLSDQISFRYILASEEYTTTSNYPCSFADTFAFILSGPGIADSNLYDHDANPATPDLDIDLGGRNIALLPNSNIPASITNIHTFTCGPGLGQFAFPQYYDTPGSNNGSTAFDGQTIPLKAEATVIPGETYTIKLVISDYIDSSFDSAVFLEGGSFDIGAFDLGQDRLLTTGNPICEGESITLDATSPLDTATYAWFRDGVELTGETNPTLDVTIPGTYSVTVSISSNCSTQDSIVIEFAPVPVANQPGNLLECAAAGVTSVEFDLSLVNNDVLLMQDPTMFNISYHSTLDDAEMDMNPLPTLYTNGVSPETIFVRIEDLSGMCFDTTTFDLEVYELAVANPVANVIICDDDSNDDVANFTLTDYDVQVLGTQDPTLFTITYHGSMDDALNNVTPLGPAFTNTSNPQTIYVRIENNANTSCNDIGQFDIQINTQPIANLPTNMAACDDNGDGNENFDLTTQEAVILDTQDPADFNITFHNTPEDATMDVNPILTPAAYTGTDMEIIHVRIDSTEPGNTCFATTNFTLSVNPLPVPVVPTTIEECDDDTDGLVGFTLTNADAEILAGQTSTDAMAITYYETLAEAQSGVGTALVSPYTNMVAVNDAVFIRIENTVTGCANTSILNLQVNPAIIANTPANYSVCDDTNGNDTDGLGTFDLSTLDAQILGALAGTATVTYYETTALATPLPTIYTTTTAGVQVIFAQVVDNITGCSDVVQVTLITDPLPNLDNIPSLIACDVDNPGDMMEMFDLTTHTTVVENGQVGLTISYHLSEADADANAGAITNLTGTDGQLIWVRAMNLLGCVQVGSFALEVQPLPLIAVPTDLEACDDDTADGIALTDLTVKNDEITLSNPDLNVSYHLTAADADGDMNALVMPYDNTATPTTYTVFVRVEDINTGCHVVTQLTVNINDTPAVFPATPLEYCDTDNDGIGIFDLTNAESEITGGVLPGQVTVTYHETPEDADNDVNEIPNETAYGNI
ncbi:choice-of-anchor L domain-containing protein, partial [uncultured Kordia sp.]|uniref:choice-of-anchor L domain-containing protein n=1 Tax=uncultured Kordia sp. TaxID=507699 RepID=UPI002628E17F